MPTKGVTVKDNKSISIDISEDEIRQNFMLLTNRPISQRTVSVGKCIAKTAQSHIIELLKLGIVPLKVGNCYLIKTEILDELFRQMGNNTWQPDKS